MCKLLSFASVVLVVSPYCIIDGCEVGRSDFSTEGLPLRTSTMCFWEQESGTWLELLER